MDTPSVPELALSLIQISVPILLGVPTEIEVSTAPPNRLRPGIIGDTGTIIKIGTRPRTGIRKRSILSLSLRSGASSCFGLLEPW